MLACFGNQYERDQLAKACDDCWVGYMWKEGILNDKIYSLIFLIMIYIICKGSHHNRSRYIYIYQIHGSQWRLLKALPVQITLYVVWILKV